MLVTFDPHASVSPHDPPGIFWAFTKFEERDLAKGAGLKWDPSTKRWWTRSPEVAKRLERFFDQSAVARLAETSGASQASILASRAETADIEVPAPQGLALLPYQRAGVAYALERQHTLIADEMGLGKTVQAIGVVNVLVQGNPGRSPDRLRGNGAAAGDQREIGGDDVLDAGKPPLPMGGNHVSGVALFQGPKVEPPNRILIICPASLRRNWLAEWQRWHVGPVRPVIVTDTWWPGLTTQTLAPAGPTAAILSYEGARKHKKHIDAITWDLLILDEAHMLKEPQAQRTRAVFGFERPGTQRHVPPIKATRRLALSGTPIVNRPAELWPLVRAFDPEGMGRNSGDYRQRYCLPPLIPTNLTMAQGIQYERQVQTQRLAELHTRLRSSIMIRRLKADVLKELPAKRRQIILVEAEGGAAALAAERAILSEKAKELAALKHEKAVDKLRMWRGAAMTEISRIRHETALKKVPAVIDHLFETLEEASKCVVWTHHHDVCDQIFECMPKGIVKFDGRMDDAEKAEAVRRFQEDPACRVFVGSIMAGGLGITLTAASVELFAELSWTPAAMTQAEDRCHRIGQKDSVLIRHLVIDGSIDQRMSRILIDKAAMIDAILDGQVPEAMRESVLDQMLAT